MNNKDKNITVSVDHLDEFLLLIKSKRGIIGYIIIMFVITYFIISACWTGLEAAGIQGNLWILSGLMSLGLLSSAFIYLLLILWETRRRFLTIQEQFMMVDQSKHALPIVSRSDELSLKEIISKANDIFIFSSRSSTYFTEFNRLLRQIKKTSPLAITILVRRDNTTERDLLLNNSQKQWYSLVPEIPFKLTINILVCDDWILMFRGLITDRNEGLLGFYLREGELTKGSEDDYLYVQSDGTEAQKYLFSVMSNAKKIMVKYSKPLN